MAAANFLPGYRCVLYRCVNYPAHYYRTIRGAGTRYRYQNYWPATSDDAACNIPGHLISAADLHAGGPEKNFLPDHRMQDPIHLQAYLTPCLPGKHQKRSMYSLSL